MKAKIALMVVLALISYQSIPVSATETNTDFSKSMNLEPSISFRGTIDTSELYFSIEPELNTNIEFKLEDTGENALKFCIYHGDGESDLIECVGGYDDFGKTHTYSEKALKDTYYLKVTCTECELDGIDDVPFMIIADYTMKSSNNKIFVISIIIVGIIVAVPIVYVVLKKIKQDKTSTTNQTLQVSGEKVMKDVGDEMTNVVQNITYNIQDSVITGGLESSVKSTDDHNISPHDTL